MLDTAEIAITGGTYPVVLAMTAGGDVEFEATTVSSSGTAVKLPGRLRTSAPILISDPATTRVRLVAFAASGTVPDRFELGQNYPNPFNPTTTIPFDLPVSASVTLVVYDILGREVATPVSSGLYPAGSHRAFFDASELGTGVYFYRIDARGEAGVRFVTGKKMLLMK
jgi:hypothetical protein